MKKNVLFLFSCILLLNARIGSAQNLVPNPSFENYYNCPTTAGELYQCQSWTNFGWTPDYFNSCSPGTTVSVPTNQFGFQYAATGTAYCGFVNSAGGPAPPPEYLGATLLQPLLSGQKYFISAKFSFADGGCPTNRMGIGFSTVSYDSLNRPPVINIAALYTDSVISDTINWYVMQGSFIADSNYTNIIIGNFFNGPGCVATTYSSYYYVDDVCVSTDSLTCYATVGINEIKNEADFILFPNPFTDKINISLMANESVEVTFYDITARKIFHQSFRNSATLSTDQLEKGIYIYEVRSGNGLYKKGKIVKD